MVIHGNTWEWHGLNKNNENIIVYQQEHLKPGCYIKSSDGSKCKKSILLYPIKNKDYSELI
jgi:hypothetical protein